MGTVSSVSIAAAQPISVCDADLRPEAAQRTHRHAPTTDHHCTGPTSTTTEPSGISARAAAVGITLGTGVSPGGAGLNGIISGTVLKSEPKSRRQRLQYRFRLQFRFQLRPETLSGCGFYPSNTTA
jgi:hypothetical protein